MCWEIDRAGMRLNKVSSATSIIALAFLKHSLSLNFQQGKSEAMFIFNGTQAMEQKKYLCHDLQYQLPFQLLGKVVVLCCCLIYKHLGSQLAVSEGVMPEIKMRAQSFLPSMSGLSV